MAEVVSQEWNTSISDMAIDILASCHRNEHLQLDRMIIKQVALLPHASFVHVNDIGPRGERMLEYVAYVSRQIWERRDAEYQPRLHFDVYGTIGDAFKDAEIQTFWRELSGPHNHMKFSLNLLSLLLVGTYKF